MTLNLWHDMEDLAEAIKARHNLTSLVLPERVHTKSCSALIKRVEETGELFFGHVTWSQFNRMIRIMKRYDFDFKEESAYSGGPTTAAMRATTTGDAMPVARRRRQ